MNADEYSRLAIRTANDLGPQGDLIHAVLLITSEAGEIADVVKKNHAYGKALDVNHLLEEVGDLCWGINLLLKTQGLTWETVFRTNIAKLEARYPDLKFDAERANTRDYAAEAIAVAGVQIE
jgi:NTP pyrophosphatase (non-canonical NTP hydrolase)